MLGGGLMYVDKIKNEKLRKKAEEILQKQFNPKLNPYKNDQYLYELRISLIELEIQNNELIETQIKFEDSNDKYFDRYKFAPLAYFILDKNGLIKEVNHAATTLLGYDKLKFHKKAFIEYVTPDHQNKFHMHYIKSLKSTTKQDIDIKLLKIDNTPVYAHLETLKALDEKGNFKELRIIVADIDDLKRTEENLKNIEENRNLLFFRKI